MNQLKEIKDIPIFMYGENDNGYIIDVLEIEDFKKFENAPIVNHIKTDTDTDLKEEIVGWVIEATRLEFPYVYGNIFVHEEFNFTKFKNYQINCEVVGNLFGENYLTNIDIMAIELE